MLAIFWVTASEAHVMSPDRATLNFRGDAAYMVLSLRLTSFEGIKFDQNNDGVISFDEFQTHQVLVQKLVAQRVQLEDEKGALTLEGVFVHFEAPHSAGLDQPSIIVLGKFAMRDGLVPTEWTIDLWALKEKGNDIEATVTTQAADGSVSARQSLVFTPAENSRKLFKKDSYANTGFMLLGISFVFLIVFLWLFRRKKVKLVEA